MTLRRFAVVLSASFACGVLIAHIAWRTSPHRPVGTLTHGEPVVVTLPRVLR